MGDRAGHPGKQRNEDDKLQRKLVMSFAARRRTAGAASPASRSRETGNVEVGKRREVTV